MRYVIFSLLVFLAVVSHGQDVPYESLPDAVQRGAVEVTPRAEGKKLWLKVRIWNTLKKVLKIKIPPGLHFRSDEPKAQDLLTVEEMTISIPAQQAVLVDMQGHCMQHYNYGPSDKDLYHFNGFAPRPLKILADSLAKYPALQWEYAQAFVWILTDHELPLLKKFYVDQILEEDVRNIATYVAEVSGLAPIQVIGVSGDKQRPKLGFFMKKGVLSFQNALPREVSFALYDENDSLIHSYFAWRKLKPGIFHYAFGVNEAIYENEPPRYYAKVKDMSGAVVAEMRVTENTEMVYKMPVPLSFNLQFTLDKPLRFAKLKLYLENGELVQELSRYRLLEAGMYDMSVETKHIYQEGTSFIAKLEDLDGNIIHEQRVR